MAKRALPNSRKNSKAFCGQISIKKSKPQEIANFFEAPNDIKKAFVDKIKDPKSECTTPRHRGLACIFSQKEENLSIRNIQSPSHIDSHKVNTENTKPKNCPVLMINGCKESEADDGEGLGSRRPSKDLEIGKDLSERSPKGLVTATGSTVAGTFVKINDGIIKGRDQLIQYNKQCISI